MQNLEIYKLSLHINTSLGIELLQAMTSNQDQDFLDMVPDPHVKQILRKEINDVAFNDQKFDKKLKEAKQTDQSINILDRPININFGTQNNNDNQDYEGEQNPYKRQRQYEFVEPDRFKIIGYQQGKGYRKPIFRMTDLYLPPNQKVQNIIDNIFKQKIYGRHQVGSQLQTHFDNTEELQKIYNNWETKEDYDQFDNNTNDLNQKDLEEVVVNLGDKKENFFLFMKNQKDPNRVQAYSKQLIKNLPMSNPNFIKNFTKAVTLLAQKNRNIQQFESESDQEELLDKTMERKEADSKLFGAYNFSIDKVKNLTKDYLSDYSKAKVPIVQEKLNIESTNSQATFSEQLVKYYSFSNSQIVKNAHLGQLQSLNRIQYHLQDPNFFLPKLYVALQRNRQFNKSGEGQNYRMQGGMGRNMNNISQLNKSKISDSLFTGNRQQFSKPSITEGGEKMFPLLDDDQQTIQKRIQIQMRNIYKEPLHHSQVALKFQLVKFTLDQNSFSKFHRYEFLYHLQFNQRTPITVVNNKSRKIKPKDLIVNTEMKNSNIKYAKKQSLSLSEGEFILIEYLEEHPIVMSNVGMCERMFIQVNYQQMLEKINQDLITDAQIDDFEEMRDNPNKTNAINSNSFQTKCQLWRKNIRQNFGDNGKLFLWEPKNAGKLIGSPEGLGVAVMESNLANYPIVKKNNQHNKRDFLLVREGSKWYLRRIEHIYVSGQVQPKKKIFNPDSRDYSVFKSSYEKAFMRRQIAMYNSVNFQKVKNNFRGQSEASLKKSLKGIRATSNDNKNYTILEGFDNNQYQLTPEDVCLYERMQKSICMLKDVGIEQIRNNEKMKNVLKQFNKRYIDSLEKFAISRMIKDQLLLTSWYLTDSFSKFKQKTSKIQIVGQADPTNGRGGYSFINKPQKQRTAKEDMEEKAEKYKVSGTNADLRKLKTYQTRQILISRGHNEEELQGKGRWGLVQLVRKQENTEYARKERETKMKKSENEKKQISRVFNKLLSYLNDEQKTPAFNYNFKKKITLKDIMEKERPLWEKTKQKMQRALNNQNVSEQDEFQNDEQG